MAAIKPFKLCEAATTPARGDIAGAIELSFTVHVPFADVAAVVARLGKDMCYASFLRRQHQVIGVHTRLPGPSAGYD